jgi:hypothetical protein
MPIKTFQEMWPLTRQTMPLGGLHGCGSALMNPASESRMQEKRGCSFVLWMLSH